MLYALAGIVIGFAAGWYFPLYLPFEYARLLSVSLMAALDTVFGGCFWRYALQHGRQI